MSNALRSSLIVIAMFKFKFKFNLNNLCELHNMIILVGGKKVIQEKVS